MKIIWFNKTHLYIVMFKSIIFLRIMLDSSISTQDHEQVWVRHQIVSKHHVVTLTKSHWIPKCFRVSYYHTQKFIGFQSSSNDHIVTLTKSNWMPNCLKLSHSHTCKGSLDSKVLQMSHYHTHKKSLDSKLLSHYHTLTNTLDSQFAQSVALLQSRKPTRFECKKCQTYCK